MLKEKRGRDSPLTFVPEAELITALYLPVPWEVSPEQARAPHTDVQTGGVGVGGWGYGRRDASEP